MFRIRQSKEGYYYVITAGNGQVLVTSQTYTAKTSVTRAIDNLVKQIRKLAGEDRLPDLIRYEGKHFKVVQAVNGNFLARSANYTRNTTLRRAVSRLLTVLQLSTERVELVDESEILVAAG